MTKATNASLKRAILGSIERLTIDAAQQDMERVRSGLYLIRDSIALLPNRDATLLVAELRLVIRRIERSAPAAIANGLRAAERALPSPDGFSLRAAGE